MLVCMSHGTGTGNHQVAAKMAQSSQVVLNGRLIKRLTAPLGYDDEARCWLPPMHCPDIRIHSTMHSSKSYAKMWFECTDTRLSVCLSVCLSVWLAGWLVCRQGALPAGGEGGRV